MNLNMNVYPCPICGRESNRQGEPFADPSATEAHITGSHSGAHGGVRGEEMREEIGSVERDEAEAEASVGPDIAGMRSRVESLEGEIERLEVESNHGMGQILGDIDELRDRLDEHERMVGELIETMEVLTLAVGETELQNAFEEYRNGTETAFRWEGPADEFVSSRGS
jgi:hypothetical protein